MTPDAAFARTSRRAAATLLVAVAALGFSACSGSASDGDGDAKATTTTAAPSTPEETTTTTRPPLDPDSIEGGEDAYLDALKPLIEKTAGFTGTDPAEVSDCIAPKWVAAIGVEGFAKAGFTPDALEDLEGGLEQLRVDEPTAIEMAKAFAECDIDIRAAVVEQLTSSPQLSDETRSCIDETLTLEVVQAAFVTTLTGDGDADQINADVQACFGQEQLPVPTTQPGG